MPKDSDGEVDIDGLGYTSSNYWRNIVTDDKQKNKPFGGAFVVGTIKVWDSGAFWAKIPKFEALLSISASQRSYTRAEDRAEQRPQRYHPLGDVFTGWEADRVRI
tara:strand:- start:2727 stop:3041 length:315 start_codon:yes stop_codon:yes gene_type:complete